MGWTVVIPVKRLRTAKSRLRGAVPGIPHDMLVCALVLDTVAATLACPEVGCVMVVTADDRVGAGVSLLGANVVEDLPDDGLNPALLRGAAHANGSGVAALTGDLPALRVDELAAALASVKERGYVADATGTGTTLLAAPPGTTLDPRFGPDSAAAHAASGAVRLGGEWHSLRRDVDTASDLREASALGVGPRTTALIGLP